MLKDPKLPTGDEIAEALGELFPKRRIRRVLLVNPPDSHAELFRFAAAKRGRNSNYPPHGLLILAERLRRIGIEVAVVSLNHEILKRCHEIDSAEDFDHDAIWQARLRKEIRALKPDLVGVTCMFTMAHTSLKNVCTWLAEMGLPVVIGGVHPSNDVDRVLEDIPCVRAAFVRECDNAFPDFIRVVNGELPNDRLSQVVLNRDGALLRIAATSIPSAAEIDVLPAWDLSDVAESSSIGIVGTFFYLRPRSTRYAPVLSNRGCRAQCTFCGVRNFNGVGVRQRPTQSVLDEIELLKNDYGIRHIMWLDDDLLKDERRALDLFNGMVQRNLGMTWDASNGVIAYSCTDEVVAAMAASGCIAVNIGMESGNRSILKRVRKPGALENFIAAATNFRKHPRIYANLLLMVGFPGETMRMIMDTLEVARAMDLDWNRISPLQPLPNTQIYFDMVAQGLIADIGYEHSSDVRFAVGVFGTQTEMEQGLRLATPDFREAFSAIPLDAVPTREQVTDIWFYMNYYLNFHRLFRETRREKFSQQSLALRALADVISPDNAFALYFAAHVERERHGTVDPAIVDRLERRLATSPFWSDRFRAFGLSVDDLAQPGNLAPYDVHLLPQGYGGANVASRARASLLPER